MLSVAARLEENPSGNSTACYRQPEECGLCLVLAWCHTQCVAGMHGRRVVFMTPPESLKVVVFLRYRIASHAIDEVYDNFGQYESGISYFLVFWREWGAGVSATILLGIRIPSPVRRL